MRKFCLYKAEVETPSSGHLKDFELNILNNGQTGVPLFVKYNSLLCCLRQVVRKNLRFVYQDKKDQEGHYPFLICFSL